MSAGGDAKDQEKADMVGSVTLGSITDPEQNTSWTLFKIHFPYYYSRHSSAACSLNPYHQVHEMLLFSALMKDDILQSILKCAINSKAKTLSGA